MQLKHYEQLLPQHCCRLATRHFTQLAMSWERLETTRRNSGIAVRNKSRPQNKLLPLWDFASFLGDLFQSI